MVQATLTLFKGYHSRPNDIELRRSPSVVDSKPNTTAPTPHPKSRPVLATGPQEKFYILLGNMELNATQFPIVIFICQMVELNTHSDTCLHTANDTPE